MSVPSNRFFALICVVSLHTATAAFLSSPYNSKPSRVSRGSNNAISMLPHEPIKSPATQLFAATRKNAGDEDDEWHPRDPAETTCQLLKGVWHQIAQGGSMVKGEEETVLYPMMEEQLNKPQYFNILLGHLDSCKDVCDHFGITTALIPYRQGGEIAGFTVKSYRHPDKDPNAFEFEYDPFWDDGTDFEEMYEGIDDELEADAIKKSNLPEIENKIPDDDDKIIGITRTWVEKLMSDMGICPFTKGSEIAGLPMGPVYYTVDRSTSMEDMYSAYWKEVVRVEQQSEEDLSTTLLIAPEFYIDNVELFESFSNTLTQPLTALGVEDLLQLVFFHPQWSFRDGGARAGGGQAANYARRSPWPMINLLRTKQVRAAQKGIPTGLVYKQNEKTLGSIGAHKLETMLRLRDWGEIAGVKVDRKEMEALKIAQEYQESGAVKMEDQSFATDHTPAANKVDANQVEQGNLVNVLLDALRKRLGKTGEPLVALNGPETSASSMAVDFLMAELEKIEQNGPSAASSGGNPKMEAARQALREDVQQPDEPRRVEEETKAMFGRPGEVSADVKSVGLDGFGVVE